ncbi:hypothetical protein Spa11_14400 [Botrimarina mediterranea]|uniref:Uncharacterized protein n=1 Tax=Botrimarina mediterranea TaxID=2528022 RepID=A0A518K624_9BACT|nr:hypothetical protein Spa11_14400 [Botrimarina mediterranea]
MCGVPKLNLRNFNFRIYYGAFQSVSCLNRLSSWRPSVQECRDSVTGLDGSQVGCFARFSVIGRWQINPAKLLALFLDRREQLGRVDSLLRELVAFQ